jgi:hypothetical protein
MIERAKFDGQIEGMIPILLMVVYQSFNMLTARFSLWNMTWKREESETHSFGF